MSARKEASEQALFRAECQVPVAEVGGNRLGELHQSSSHSSRLREVDEDIEKSLELRVPPYIRCSPSDVKDARMTHLLTQELLHALRRAEMYAPDPTHEDDAIKAAECVLCVAFKIGPELKFDPEEEEEVCNLITKTLDALSMCLIELTFTLEEVSINDGKVLRSGLELLLDRECYKLVRPDEDFFQSLKNFKNDESDIIEEFEEHLKNLSQLFEPRYSEKVSRPAKIPESHWWWDL